MTSTEIAVREPAVAAERDIVDGWVEIAGDIFKLAAHICETDFVPKAYRGNAPAAAAAILTGRELGLGPMMSLRHVQVVEGSPSLSAEYKRARVLSAGHEFTVLEWSNTLCRVKGRRRGSHEPPLEVTYTMDDAKRAGLIRDKSGWVRRPRRMLFARAGTDLCDALFSDVVNGLPTTELLEEDRDADIAPETASQRPGGRVTAAEIIESRPAADPEQGTAEPGSRHGKLVGAVQGHLKRLGFTVDDADREERLRILASIARVAYDDDAINSTSDFDDDELKAILDALAQCRDRTALNTHMDALTAEREQDGSDA